MIYPVILLISVSAVLSQDQPPPFRKLGCPPATLTPGDNYCFSAATSCLPTEETFPEVPKNNNVYKIIRARSWWFCGKL